MKPSLIASLLALLCTACAMTPEQSLPSLDLPQSAYNAPIAKDWWKTFDDPLLNTLIAQTLQHNHNLSIAIARIEEARAKLGISSSAQWPRLELQSMQQNSRDTSTIQVAGAASWELDLWGRLANQTEASKQQLLSTQAAHTGLELALSAETAQAYFNLRALDAQLLLAKQTVASRKAAFSLQTKRFQGGLISELEARQAESDFATARTIVPQYQAKIAQAESILSVLSGQSPRALIEEGLQRGKQISDIHIANQLPSQIPSDLLLRRPDIAEAEAKLRASHADVAAARAAWFPRISLAGVLGTASNPLANLFAAGSKTWQFAGNLGMPLFDGGLNAAQIDQARAQDQAAAAGYRQAVQNAFADAYAALKINQFSLEKTTAQTSQNSALEHQLKLAILRYDNGYSDYLTVLDSERNLFNGRLELISATRDQLLAQVSLFKALGGGATLN
ncbi:efflux transporter outer membrane subunit [Iodobacter sp. CM08]|uniref:efflux transporter outer membrane subunit n=1 Tax=Iodobacter sp. CM08 TaxID=3085902 RepID=UPI002981A272|nr:efflux transporter outer membrane subunit [Iodobacter sp. CM08]MDW5418459.1 efflux transporter outer membrane subunit [Iodobacter sp. CM08]